MTELPGSVSFAAAVLALASSIRSWKRLGRRLRPPCALCQVMLIKGLPDQRLDNRLAAHVEGLCRLIQFRHHARRDVHVSPFNRLHHAPLSHEEMENVLALIG